MTMRIWIVMFALLGGAVASPTIAAVDRDVLIEASTFVRSLDEQASALLRSKNLDHADGDRSFRAMFVGSFDVPAIGRFVLGRYWRTSMDAQGTEFLGLFEDMMVRTYSRRFVAFGGQHLANLGTRAEGDSALVASTFAQPNGPAVKLDWRMITAEDQGGAEGADRVGGAAGAVDGGGPGVAL